MRSGIVSTAALRAAGLTRAGIASAVARGGLRRLRRGVFGRAGCCARLAEAATHGGRLACASAARELGLWVLDESDDVHVWMTAGGHGREHAGCRCVEHWDSDLDDPAPGWTVSLRRALRQILACFGVEHFFVSLESALRQGMLSPVDLEWLRTHTNPVAREALAFARSDADSGLESLVRWRLRNHGLSVRTQVSIFSVGRIDLVVGERLLVEVDGTDNHDGPSLRHKDLVRDANAATWGYVTLRFDYALVVRDWELVEAAILGLVRRGIHEK